MVTETSIDEFDFDLTAKMSTMKLSFDIFNQSFIESVILSHQKPDIENNTFYGNNNKIRKIIIYEFDVCSVRH